jgi:hypothetical protein
LKAKNCILMIVALVAGGTASAQLSPAQLSEQQMQAEAYEDATGSTPEEAAEEFSSGMDQWLDNLLDEAPEVGTNALNDFLRAFSPENLMPELPELARQWRIPFYALAMMIFISSAISTLAKYRSGSPDATQAGVSLILAILLAVNVVPTINFFIGAADSIVDYGAQRANVEVDLTNPWALAENLTDLAWTFSRVDIAQGEPFEQVMVAASVRAGPDATALESVERRSKKLTDRIGDVVGGVIDRVRSAYNAGVRGFLEAYNPFTLIKRFFYAIVITICAYASALVAAIIVMFFDALRFLLLHVGSIILPAAIAASTTSLMRNQGSSYVFGMIGIAAWPIGWVFVNIVAYSLQKVQIRLLNAQFLLTDSDDLSGALVNSIGSGIFTMGLDTIGLILLLQLLVVAVIIGGYLTASIIIQRVVTSGGMIAPAIVATGMQWVGAVGGAMGRVPGLGAAGRIAQAAGTGLSTASRSVDDSPPIVSTSGRPVQFGSGAMDGRGSVGAIDSSPSNRGLSPSQRARAQMKPLK